MNSDEFVRIWKDQKDELLENSLNPNNGSAVAEYINKMKLSSNQKDLLNMALDQLLTDTFYTLLLGLDGCAAIGGTQQSYKIYDENNNLISTCGDLEVAAYEQFQEG